MVFIGTCIDKFYVPLEKAYLFKINLKPSVFEEIKFNRDTAE